MGLPLGFASPLVLLGLLSLPVLWWLLRLIPPRPRRIEFPPTRLLFDIKPKEDTPSRTPWWLTLLRLTLATLVILAAAGPLWNPPTATTTGATAIALLIDDGFSAAASWDARVRTADDLIARAEADNRGYCAHSAGRGRPRYLVADAGRGASGSQPDETQAARDRACRCAAGHRASAHRHAEHGNHLAVRRRRSRPRLRIRRGPGQGGRRPPGQRGRRRPADRACAGRRRQRRRRTDRKGAARHHRGNRARVDPRARSQGPAARRSPLCLQGRRARDRRRAQPAGRDPQRHRPRGNSRRKIRGHGAIARQALAAAHRRHRHRRHRGDRAAAARLHVLSWPRAQPVCRREAGRARRARRGGAPLHRARRADDHPGRRRQRRRRSARPPVRLGRWRRHAGALRGPPPRRFRRRSGAGEAAPRRPYPGRQPELGSASATHGVLARRPVRQHAGAQRRDRHAPGAGGAGGRADRPHLGDAGRRHAARHRGEARQGHDRSLPRHRRHALVRPAAVRRVRRYAPAHRGAGRLQAQPRRTPTTAPHARWCRRPACSTASVRSARRRRPRGRCPRAMRRARRPTIRRAFTARRTDCSRSTRSHRPTGL